MFLVNFVALQGAPCVCIILNQNGTNAVSSCHQLFITDLHGLAKISLGLNYVDFHGEIMSVIGRNWQTTRPTIRKKKQVYVQQRSLKNKIPLVDVYLVKERNITTSYKKTELFAIRNHGEMKAQKSNEEQFSLPVNFNLFFPWNPKRKTF